MYCEVDNLVTGYEEVVRHVIDHGALVSPRGMDTFEVLAATVVIHDPTRALPLGVGRGASPAIAAAEALQLIGGVSDLALMCRVAPQFARYADGGSLHGAYGPRLRAQLPTVVRRLAEDPDTRQAVVTLWDPARDAHVDHLHDYPCTVAMQFMIRDMKLIMHTFMRSNDVWLGLAHDAFQFTQLQLTVCNILGIEPGPYYHHANSLHIYLSNIDAVRNLHPYDGLSAENLPDGMPSLNCSGNFGPAAEAARDILAGCDDADWMSTAERWYIRTLGEYTQRAA